MASFALFLVVAFGLVHVRSSDTCQFCLSHYRCRIVPVSWFKKYVPTPFLFQSVMCDSLVIHALSAANSKRLHSPPRSVATNEAATSQVEGYSSSQVCEEVDVDDYDQSFTTPHAMRSTTPGSLPGTVGRQRSGSSTPARPRSTRRTPSDKPSAYACAELFCFRFVVPPPPPPVQLFPYAAKSWSKNGFTGH